MASENKGQNSGSVPESTGDSTGGSAGHARSIDALSADLFVERLAPAVRESLSPDQLAEIRRVATQIAPREHTLDWRVSLPAWFGGRRFYGVMLAGADRRGPQRRARDRMVRRQRRRSAIGGLQIAAVVVALLVLILMVAVGAVRAEEVDQVGIEGTDDRKPIGADEWPWTALGRVNREVGGHCTGALVAPDLVLTAAHCLYNFSDGRWTIPMEVHFVAGYHRGAYQEHAVGRKFEISPDWDPAGAKQQDNIGRDWALIELDRRLDTKPMKLSSLSFAEMRDAAEDGALAIAGYNGDFAEILTEDRGCNLVGMSAGGGMMLHDCDATFGASGAPLLLITGKRKVEIIGLQSAVVEMQGGGTLGAAVPIEAFRSAADD